MLARAAVRSMRLRAALPIAPSHHFPRRYASKRPSKRTSTGTPNNPFAAATSSETSDSASASSSKIGSAAKAFADTTESKGSSQSENAEYSRDQVEFETGKSSAENTAPQSTSPSAVDPAAAEASQPAQPLPDLTKGIPSTFEAEFGDAAREAARQETVEKSTGLNVTEDPEQPGAGGGGKDGGDTPKSAYVSSLERRRNRMFNLMYAGAVLFGITGTIYLGRNWETEEEERKFSDCPNGWGLGLFYNRASARLSDMLSYYNEPAFPKLLPDPDPAWERPYTLVLSLEDLLIHSEWTREHGWRLAKRPGVDYFLRYLSQYYELVIFTSVPSFTADPIIRKLDPYRIVMWPLFREATRYRNGEYIKDLSYLNRDLSKVIMIDTDPVHAKLQPENAIILPKWKGDPNDRELVGLIPFLEYVATMGFDDTRKALQSFEGTHIPTEFARREAIVRQKFQEQLAEEKAKRPKHSGLALLGNLLGLKPTVDGMEPTAAEGFEQGKMLQDQIRERGQKAYEALEKQIRENGETWLKEMAAEEERMKEESLKGMKSSFASFGSVFGGSTGQK